MSRRGKKAAIAVGTGIGVAAIATLIWLPGYPRARLAPTAGTSLTITDRHGEVLRVLPAAAGGRSRWVPLSQIAPQVILATLAGEDRRFFRHSGVDGRALLRAAWLVVRHGRVVSGASTITMQLVRALEPHPRSVAGKVTEIVQAFRLERTLDKRGVLEQYLNRVSYGAGSVGIEAGARRFFGKSAAALNAGEATLLAVVPRAPRAYDLRTGAGRAAALARRAQVLSAMVETGSITGEERAAIEAAPVDFATADRAAHPVGESVATGTGAAPHFVDWVLAQRRHNDQGSLAVADPDATLATTLDLPLQRQIEGAVSRQLAERPDGARQAGVVVLDPATGEVRAMVGSPDYAAAESGQVNVTTAARHPGSTLKPFLYALAMEAGATPASLADDRLAAVPNHHPARRPREHGPTRYREALGGSLNLAALDVIGDVGVGRLLERLRASGVGPLAGSSNQYGRALALGTARVRLVDLAAAYGAFVKGGVVAAARIFAADPPRTTRIFSPEVSWLVLDMLADAGARRAAFGAALPFDLPFPVAAKTGTSAGFSDTLAIAVTSEAVVAAWAGSFDGSGTRGTLAMWSAAPLARAGLLAVAAQHGGRLHLPPAPRDLIARDVCTVTGLAPVTGCPHKREWFINGRVPGKPCDGHPPPNAASLVNELALP